MTIDEIGMTIMGGLIGLVVFALGFLLGGIVADNEDKIHDEAVKNGVAEYYLDNDNMRQFRWRPINPEQNK